MKETLKFSVMEAIDFLSLSDQSNRSILRMNKVNHMDAAWNHQNRGEGIQLRNMI